MRRFTILLMGLASVNLCSAQFDLDNLKFESGFNFSTLDFVDSNGEASLDTDFTMSPESRFAVFIESSIEDAVGLSINLGVSMDELNLRAQTETDYLTYDLNYVSALVELKYDLYDLAELINKENSFSCLVDISGGTSVNYLISGYQEYDENLIDLRRDSNFSEYYFDMN